MTSLAAGAAMTPVWAAAGARLRRSLSTRQVPYLAIGAAFCFTVMMFNIPVPGGTTVHPIGATLLAILLGPWAAVIGVTVALVIQALFFADGGVIALGANCFIMAFAMPFCGYFVYQMAAIGTSPSSPRRVFASALGAYVGLNAAALLIAVILGIQPALFRDASGQPLYFPFGLKTTIPAIMSAHLLVAGFAEAVVTALSIKYAMAAGMQIYATQQAKPEVTKTRLEHAWIGLGVLIALAPLGLLARGEAWGEWSSGEIARRAGYLPGGLTSLERHGWKGFNLFPDYLSDRGALFYILAAVIGVGLIVCATYLISITVRECRPSAGGDVPRSSNHHEGDIPSWLLIQGSEFRQNSHGNRRRFVRMSHIEKTLAGITKQMRETVFAETWAKRDGLLQKLDPRSKAVGLLGMAAVISFAHRPLLLVGICFLLVVAARLSQLPVSLFLRRVLLSMGLFSAAIIVPAALNLVTPGRPVIKFCSSPDISLTDRGLALAGLLALRVGAAVGCVTLLALTTRWDDLLFGLRSLFVPRSFLIVLAMTYRYLCVMMQVAVDLLSARVSRTVGRTSHRSERSFLGHAVGSMFGKATALTDEVHHAMISRGWTGSAESIRSHRFGRLDYAWLACFVLFVALTVLGERMG
jgi:cobalt/nickel transport system permease protein